MVNSVPMHEGTEGQSGKGTHKGETGFPLCCKGIYSVFLG